MSILASTRNPVYAEYTDDEIKQMMVNAELAVKDAYRKYDNDNDEPRSEVYLDQCEAIANRLDEELCARGF